MSGGGGGPDEVVGNRRLQLAGCWPRPQSPEPTPPRNAHTHTLTHLRTHTRTRRIDIHGGGVVSSPRACATYTTTTPRAQDSFGVVVDLVRRAGGGGSQQSDRDDPVRGLVNAATTAALFFLFALPAHVPRVRASFAPIAVLLLYVLFEYLFIFFVPNAITDYMWCFRFNIITIYIIIFVGIRASTKTINFF